MTQLYLISPPKIADNFAEQFRAVCDAFPPAVFQLRLKDTPDAEILKAAEKLLPICSEYGVVFIINDRADLAVKSGAAGVHIGGEDGTLADARKIVGKDAIVGVSCYDSKHAAIEAAEQGADYVAFGSVFETTTKTPKARAPLELIEWWASASTVPCCAIGGITHGNITQIIETGAEFAAIISAVWDAPEGAAASAATFRKLLEE